MLGQSIIHDGICGEHVHDSPLCSSVWVGSPLDSRHGSLVYVHMVQCPMTMCFDSRGSRSHLGFGCDTQDPCIHGIGLAFCRTNQFASETSSMGAMVLEPVESRIDL